MSIMVGKGWRQGQEVEVTPQAYTGSRDCEQEVGHGYELSKSTAVAFLQQGAPPESSIGFLNSTICWGPSV